MIPTIGGGRRGPAGPQGGNGTSSVDGTTATTFNGYLNGNGSNLNAVTSIPQADVANLTTALAGKEATANKNQANGYAGLDSAGLVPAALLPSYVDDVLEYANLAGFPGTGETGKIYVDKATGKIYRWSGSAYIEISPSPGSTDSVTEGSTNLYFTETRVRASVLTGLAAAASLVAPAATDSVLVAWGKVVKLFNSLGNAATLNVGTTTGTVAAGDDARLTNSRTPSAVNSGVATNITGLIKGAASALAAAVKGTDYLAPDQNAKVVALTDAASIAVDCTLGNHFRVTLGGNRTLANPTGATDGQRLVFEVVQDATGSRTLAYGNKFAFGSTIASVTLTTGANKRDFITAIYNSTADKFYVVGFSAGF